MAQRTYVEFQVDFWLVGILKECYVQFLLSLSPILFIVSSLPVRKWLSCCLSRVHTVMEFEICILGLEKLWKFEKYLFGSWKVLEFLIRFFPKLFLAADGWKVKKFSLNFVSNIKTFSRWCSSLIVFTSPLLSCSLLQSILRPWNWIKSRGIFLPNFCVNPFAV